MGGQFETTNYSLGLGPFQYYDESNSINLRICMSLIRGWRLKVENMHIISV